VLSSVAPAALQAELLTGIDDWLATPGPPPAEHAAGAG
jgi:hypothetical protein